MRDRDDDEAEPLDAVEMDRGASDPDDWSAVPSQFTCPSCHGSLFERRDGTILRYRCRTGHAFSGDSMLAAQSKGVEDALWIAFRALEENAALFRRLASRAVDCGQARLGERFATQAESVQNRAQIIRDALLAGRSEEVV